MGSVIMRERAFACDGFGNRDAVLCCKRTENIFGAGIAHASARNDQRSLGAFENFERLSQTILVGARTRNDMDGRFEKGFRVIPGHFLHVLRQRDESRAAIRRIEQDSDSLWQRRDNLFRVGNAIPIARHGAEGIIDVDRRVTEMLNLLHYRIGTAIDECVTGEQQNRQAVGMGNARGSYHVQGAWPD